MRARDESIPLDETVFAVRYDDPHIGSIYMPEVARSEAEARTHWRFTADWLGAEPRRRTHVQEMTHREFIELAYTRRSANPFEGIANVEFIDKMRRKFGAGA